MAKPRITNNELLSLGVGIFIVGIILTNYSFSVAGEMNQLRDKFDYEMIDNNNQISSSEKYYTYLEYGDFLTQKLKKNQNLPIKNSSCIYLDYAKHNAIQLNKLVTNKFSADEDKQGTNMGNIRALYNMLDNYKNCSQASEYKELLGSILEGNSGSEKQRIQTEEKINEFLYDNKPQIQKSTDPEIPNAEESEETQSEQQTIQEPNFIDSNGHAQTLTPEQIEYINKQQSITNVQ